MYLFRFFNFRSGSTDRPSTSKRSQRQKIELCHMGTVFLRLITRRTDIDRVQK